MQIIQKIRDKGAAIVIVVIALSLIGFILMDAKPGGKFSGSSQSTVLGKVNGQKIESADFNTKVNIAEDQQAQQSGQKPNSVQSAQLRENVWNKWYSETIFFEEAKKLDIELTPTELTSILMSNDPATH
jgi:peptidyl-prolyl cis-trans isomerase D